MRIAYICCDPGIPVFGTKGASVHIQEVVRELRAAGHEVALYALRSGEHVPTDLADLELHLETVANVSPAEREQAQVRAAQRIASQVIADGADLVYERYSLFSTALADITAATGVPGVLEVNAPLIDEQRRHRSLVDASGAEHWRDPFVFEHDGRWHMLITARARGAENYRAGVIGHAVSEDLDHWQVLPPLTGPSVFGQLEVSQSRSVDGHHLLIFSCGDDMKAEPGPGGVWVAEGEGALGPWDIDGARYVRPEHLYAGQLLQLRDGAWVFTGFENIVHGEFVGAAPDLLPWEDIELLPRDGH